MAYAIAIAAAITGLLATPALAAEDVYVWRDASGVVRFTTVQKQLAEGSATDATVCTDRDADSQIAANATQN
jgi:hypothetical protein